MYNIGVVIVVNIFKTWRECMGLFGLKKFNLSY